VDGAEVVAHVAQLARPGVGRGVGVVDGLGGPHADVAVAAGRGQSRAIGRDVAAVDLKVLLFAWMGVRNVVSECPRVPLSANAASSIADRVPTYRCGSARTA
jgi:hypothetical protein